MTSHVPTAAIVTTPRGATEQAEFVVPVPSANAISSDDDADAVTAKLDDPNATAEGWAKAMFWLIEPTAMVCVISEAAVKLVSLDAEAVITQSPEATKVTTPSVMPQVPDAVNAGVMLDAAPVMVEFANADGV